MTRILRFLSAAREARRRPAAAGFLALLAVAAWAAFPAPLAAAPVAADVQTLETDDLRLVYYGPTLSFIAPHAARCFENSMRFYRRLFDYRPSEKVNVILDDFSDYSNAAVWVTPRNSMLVHIAPANFVYETGPSNERINFTMNHEVAHVLTLDQAAGSDAVFRRLFHGKVNETAEHPETMLYSWLTVPRRGSPRWYREGIATFFETWMAGGLGRAQGPYDEMVFRSMVRDSAHIYDPLGLESEGTKVDFQSGVNSYLYGTRFLSYLVWEYGPESLLGWVSRTPGSRAYFAAQFQQVYGRPLGQAWRDWIAWERSFQRANLDAVRRYPTTPYRDLSRRGLGSVSRAFVDSAGATVYVAVYHPGALAYIGALSLGDGEMRHLHEVKGPALYFVSSLAYDPEGGQLFYTADNDEWRDLCVLDVTTGRSRVLIRDARIGDLAFNQRDRALWGVRHFNGISSVVRLPFPWRDWNLVASFPYGRDLYDLDISPDGTLLAASMAEISGRQTLQLVRLDSLLAGDTASRTLYDFGASIPTGFVFSPDGGRLFGNSYYTGVSNIFRYDLAADSMEIVTNAETGFFRPVPWRADSLIVFRYGGQGFVPAVVEARPLQDVSAITFLGAQLVEKYPLLKEWKVPSPAAMDLDSAVTFRGGYRGLRGVAPTTFYPVIEGYKDFAAVGWRCNFSDPVAVHTADLSATYSPASGVPGDERWHVAAGWQHRNWTAKFRYNGASFYDLFGPTKVSRKGTGGSVGYSMSLVRDPPRTLDLSAEVSGYTGLERLPVYQNVPTSPGFDKLVGGRVGLEYKNVRSSIGAVDPEKGYRWGIEMQADGVRYVRAERVSWRGFPGVVGTLDVGLPLPRSNSSVWLRSAAGHSFGDRAEPFAYYYFGGFGNNWVDYQDPKRYRHYLSFPGIGLNAAGGTDFSRALLEWNLPPLRFERAGVPAFYATWTRLSVFATGLVTNLERPEDRQRLANAGAQADLRIMLFMQQPLTLSLGYARAFERHRAATDEWMISLKLQ